LRDQDFGLLDGLLVRYQAAARAEGVVESRRQAREPAQRQAGEHGEQQAHFLRNAGKAFVARPQTHHQRRAGLGRRHAVCRRTILRKHVQHYLQSIRHAVTQKYIECALTSVHAG